MTRQDEMVARMRTHLLIDLAHLIHKCELSRDSAQKQLDECKVRMDELNNVIQRENLRIKNLQNRYLK